NRRRSLLGGSSSSAAAGGNDIHWNAGEIACNGGKPVGLPFRRPIFKSNIPTFDISEFAQSSPKVVPDRRIIDDADARNLRRSLLPPRRQRPRRRPATEQRNELSSPHSITSSASASNFAGNSIPSALAVLRLTINSSFVGCITGRSVGFSP